MILKQVKDIIPNHVQVVSIRQEDALGLGHAILCASRLIDSDEPFAVLLPDVLLIDQPGKPLHSSFKAAVAKAKVTGVGQIMVEKVNDEDVDKYGIVDINGNQLASGESAAIKGMVEKPKPEYAPSNLAVLGRYVLTHRVMELLKFVEPGAGGEIQLTDALDQLLKEQPLDAFLSDADVHDCGNKYGFVRANVAVARREGMAIE